MPLSLPCPHCRAALRLDEPFPAPGATTRCPSCGGRVRVRYPDGLVDKLQAKGRRFLPPETEPARVALRTPPPPAMDDDEDVDDEATPPTTIDHTLSGGDGAFDFGGPRRPRAAPQAPRPASMPAPEPPAPAPPPTPAPKPTPAATPPPRPASAEDGDEEPTALLSPPPPKVEAPPVRPRAETPRLLAGPEVPWDGSDDPGPAAPPPAPPVAPAPERPSRWRRALLVLLLLLVAAAAAAAIGWWWLKAAYAEDLPSIEALRAYRPATVTSVTSKDGELMGELYEERRYVLPLAAIPQQVQDAFVAAEDARFWSHGGIDAEGIARAMGRNLAAGRISQGGSTITQQVAKNFLLSSDRRLERKIKEMFLSWRIEEAYSKEHILYLYLNEIFLGSQAYGVEAASRTFFGHPASEMTLGEAAMIAGLPPRPSAWNPHTDFSAAKNRQAYVLGQMVKNGFVTQADADAAAAEDVAIVPRGNTFRSVAPHFTEHVRRHLVERYGAERVLADGLTVVTTCDLALQTVAQDALTRGIHDVDQRMGFRRRAIEHLDGDDAIQDRIGELETAMIAQRRRDEDPAGRAPPPSRSRLEPDEVHTGVVLEVQPTWARVAVGSHEGVIPIAWSTWVYEPNPDWSWRYRKQERLDWPVDDDKDGTKDGGILRRGDVVKVKVRALSTRDEAVADVFDGTPGADADRVALALWQTPEVEGAVMTLEVSDDLSVDGAVRAMVGGADFSRSQLNRVVQSRRQVGSTFKPIVYGAALASRKLTAATIVPDAPLALGQGDELWKPGNYGDDFKGNITLRQALALSRNTSTVRVLEMADPGMNDDVVHDFARALGLGGPPAHTLPDDAKPTPDTDYLCPWIEPPPEQRWCLDQFDTDDGRRLCRACDLSMALGSASLTMEELVRAYAVFAAGGRWVEPWYVAEVTDRDGEVLEHHEAVEPVQVVEPDVATLVTWLMQEVVNSGTAIEARRRLGVPLAGKTGTTNEERDAWFMGFSPDYVTGTWVGFDDPRPLGVSSTGGRTALPIWLDVMEAALADKGAVPFTTWGELEWAEIDESTGRLVAEGGRPYPFLEGTLPDGPVYQPDESGWDDLTTEL